VWLLLLIACGPPEPPPAPEPFAPGPPCPVGMLDLGPGRAMMGLAEPDPKHGSSQIPISRIEVERFCIDPYPFPGQPGDHYPFDGLAYRQVQDWEQLLQAYGRRLCSPEELLWAAGSGPANLRFAAGPERGMLCETADSWETMKPLGSWPACVSPFGLYEFNVMSSWASASPTINDLRQEPHPKQYAVVGGTMRDDTFYAPDNWGIHEHGLEDFPYFDDQLRVCADPGVYAEPADWLLFRQAAANQGSFGAAMAWHHAYGPDATTEQVWAAPPMPDPVPWW
jgi:hypothetical protein